MSFGAWVRKWTFREPVLAWTAYWCLAGLTVPFAVKYAVESSRTAPPKQPPTTREMIEAIRDQHAQRQQQQQKAAQA